MAAPNQQLVEFENLVLGNLNPQNQIRQEAERLLTKVRDEQPPTYMMGLLALLKESQKQDVREFAAVMLRQNLLVNSSSKVWINCSADTKKQIQSCLLYLFHTEPLPVLRRKITDAVAATATRISGTVMFDMSTNEQGMSRSREGLKRANGEAAAADGNNAATPWPELMPTVMDLAQKNAPETRESLCNLVEKLGEFNPDSLFPHLDACRAIILNGMKDSVMTVRLAGLRACVRLLEILNEKQRQYMVDTVPIMFDILGVAFQKKDDESISHAVMALCDLAEAKESEEGMVVPGGAKFLKPHMKDILPAMMLMASSPTLDSETRRVCLAFLLIIVEEGKGMIRKQQEFAQQVIPLAFKFLADLEDTAAWSDPHLVETEDDDDGFENFKFGAQAIERLSHALGGKVFLGVATPLINAALQDKQHWNYRHAAFIAMGKMAVGCDQHLFKQLNAIMEQYVTPFALNDPHPRVRWAAIEVIAMFSEAYEPDFANDFTAPIFETLLACMNPTSHWRVIATALSAIPDVLRGGMEKEQLEPFSERILKTLVPLLGMLQFPQVVEASLAALATIASVNGTDFAPFYDQFMPGVKGLIMSCSTPQLKGVRGKAVECLGMMAQHVGAVKFRPELVSVMDALMGMSSLNLSSDDPLHGHIVTTMARVCKAVGKDFLPYLPRIVPGLIKSAGISDACVVVNEGDENKYRNRDGWTTDKVHLRGTGLQEVNMNTSLMEEKALAIRMIFEYCNTLGGDFAPYVQECINQIVPLVRYQFEPQLRECSVISLPPFMRCVKEATASNPAQMNEACKALFDKCWPQVIEAMKVEPDLEDLGTIVNSFREVIEYYPLPLTDAQINELNVLLFRLVAELLKRCKQRDELSRSADHDETQQEIFDLENEAEDELLGCIYNMINALVKNSRERYLVDFNGALHAIFLAMLQCDDLSLMVSGLCVIGQLVEDCPNHPIALEYCKELFPVASQHAESEDVGLMQSCVFALGVCSIVWKQNYAKDAPKVLQQLTKIVKSDLGQDYAVATDNAISSIAKIFIYTYNSGVPAANYPACPESIVQLMGSWVQFLPCDGDLLESQKIHDMLCNFILSNNTIVMGGESFGNLPIVLGIFGKILARVDWEDLCTPETKNKIVQIFQQVQKAMPEITIKQMYQAMNAEQKEAFKPYFLNAAVYQ